MTTGDLQRGMPAAAPGASWARLGAYLSELTMGHADKIVQGTQRPFSDKPNKSALAAKTYMNRNAIAGILEGTRRCQRLDVENILRVLSASPSEVARALKLWDAAIADDPSETGSRKKRPPGPQARPGELRSDGFVRINKWTPARPLCPENLATSFAKDHPRIDLPDIWHEYREDFIRRRRKGSVASVISFDSFDYRKTDEDDVFGLTLAPIDYASQLATREYFARDSAEKERLMTTLSRGMFDAFLEETPPAAVAMNINVVSSDRKALLIRRSGSVLIYANEWNLGINETMRMTSDHQEDFFGLIERGLWQEVGLRPKDVERTVVSWFGFCFDCGNFYLFAHAFTNLTSREIGSRLQRARDSYEHEDSAWIRIEEDSLAQIVSGGEAPDRSRRWLHHARLSAI